MFSINNWTNQDSFPPFCFSPDHSDYNTCENEKLNDFFQPLVRNSWTNGGGYLDGQIYDSNGQLVWTSFETQASNITSSTANLLVVSTHGGVNNGNDAYFCLRDCDGTTFGSTYGVDTRIIPNAWLGPTWLAMTACSAVQQNVGWESKFGAHLHGILGYNSECADAVSPVWSQFSQSILGWDTAWDEWPHALFAQGITGYGMLIPARNTSDVIEANGGPHFGYDNSTGPDYWVCCDPSGGPTPGAVTKFSQPINNAYNLTSETMNEPYWYNLYGGSNVPSVLSTSDPNIHTYRNAVASVTHFVSSGGLLVESGMSGTVYGFTKSEAYSYALTWLQSNGALPADASLDLAGTARNYYDTIGHSFPYSYVFRWLHGTSALFGGDSIIVGVDDTGYWHQHCWIIKGVQKCDQEVWIPEYHVHEYRRVWRTIGTLAGPIQRISYNAPGPSQGYGLCAPSIESTSNVALPCDLYQTNGNSTTTFVRADVGTNVMQITLVP